MATRTKLKNIPFQLRLGTKTKKNIQRGVIGCLSLILSLTSVSALAQSPASRDIRLNEIKTGTCVPNPAQPQSEITCTFPLASSVNASVVSENILIGIRDQNGDIFYEGKRCAIQNQSGYKLVCKLNLGFRVEDLRNFSSFQWTPDAYQHDIVLIDERTYTENTNKALINIKSNTSPYSSWKSDYAVRTKLVSSLTESNNTIYQTFVDFNGKIRVRSLVPDNLVINTSSNPYDVSWKNISHTPPASEFTSLPVDMTVLNGRFYQVHVGRDGRVYTRSSNNAKNWTRWFRDDNNPNERTRFPVNQAILNGKLFQNHVGNDGKVYTRSSTDGKSWSKWSRDARNSGESTNKAVTMVSKNGKIYQAHIGGNKLIYMRSSLDGVSWSRWSRSAGNDSTDQPVSLAVNNTTGRLYRSRVGLDSKVYTQYSDNDGTTWTIWREYGGTSNSPSSIYVHNGILLQLITSNSGYIFWRF